MAENCPKCGAPDVGDEQCPRCRVNVPLYRVALAKFRRAVPADGPVTTPTLDAAPAAAPRAASPPPTTRTLTFHGRGGTLLRIHLVSVLLTILTLGVFAFWGKVRVRRYLLAQTELAGDRFAYHGTGGELLLGALKVMLYFLPLALLHAAAVVSRDPGMLRAMQVVTAVTLAAFVPIAVVGARRYRLSRVSWRGIRFGFDGAMAAYVKLFWRCTGLMVLTLGVYYPIAHARSHAFLVAHSRFGSRAFGYDGQARAMFRPYLRALLLAIPTLGLSFFWYLAWRRRYYWNHTTFERARFHCTITGRQLLGLWAVNVVLLALTLGLGWPWVRVRNARLALATLAMDGPLSLDAIAQEPSAASATGDALSGVVGVGVEFGA